MTYRFTCLLFAALFSVAACADDTPSGNGDNELTGKRFFDSAATKFMMATPGMERKKANCIVSGMTADGTIGLGEINNAKLDDSGVPTRGSLKQAYQNSIAACA